MTITVSPGCSWSPTTQSSGGSFNCMVTASMNSSGCTATLTNESFQTDCDDNYDCDFTEVNNIKQSLICDGSNFTITTAIGPQSVTSVGTCTCQAGAAANPSASTTGSAASGSSTPASGSSTPASGSSTPASGSSTPTSGSSTLVRTSTALLVVYVVAASIVGSL
ncbi:unnamed protein product [Umbelopsis ramanniana]